MSRASDQGVFSEPIIVGPSNLTDVRSAVVDHMKLDQEYEPSFLERLSDGIRSIVFGLLRVLSGIHTNNTVSSPTDIKRIVLFRYDAIGDYIVSTPFISWLKRVSPNVEIDVVGSTRNAAILKSDPNINSVTAISAVESGYNSTWGLVKDLIKERKPDMIAALVFTRMTKAALLAMYAGGSASRLTIKHANRSHIYGKVFDRQVPHLQAWEHWFDTMGNVGTRTFNLEEETPQPYVVLTSDAVATTAKKLGEKGIALRLPDRAGVVQLEPTTKPTEGAPYFLLNVAGSFDDRVLTVEKASALINRALELHPRYHCIVTGGPERAELVASVVKAVDREKCSSYMGTLQEAFVVVAGSSMVITPDTAIVHVASIAGVPVLSMSVTALSVSEWGAYKVPFRTILSSRISTIDVISEEMHIRALEELSAEVDLPAPGDLL